MRVQTRTHGPNQNGIRPRNERVKSTTKSLPPNVVLGIAVASALSSWVLGDKVLVLIFGRFLTFASSLVEVGSLPAFPSLSHL